MQRESPDAATGIPVRITFGPFGLIGVIGYLALPVVSFLVLHFIFEFRIPLGLFLGVVGVLLEIAAALPHFDNLNRAVVVSEEGVRLEKIHRSYVIPWWQLRALEASPDVNQVRILGSDAQITFSTTHVPVQEVENLIHSIRAHAREHGVDLVEMSRGQRFKDNIIPMVGHLGAAAIFVIGAYFTFPGTLGMRCSANSAYLQERYSTPDRQGCVVLRVSAGAAKAGVKVGDLLVEFEGYPVTSGSQFSAIFDQSRKPWDVTVIRRGEPEQLHFKVEGGWGKTFQEDEGDPIFYYLRARWNAVGHPQSAIDDYTRAIELDPEFDLAYLYRGELYGEAGDEETALRDMERALELSPGLGEAHSTYAYFVDLRDPESALDHIQQAARLDKCEGAFEGVNIDCATDYLELAHLQLLTAAEAAVTTALQAIRFYNDFAHPYFVAACGLSRTGRLEEARHYAEEYLGFPESERIEDSTVAAKIILSGEGIC